MTGSGQYHRHSRPELAEQIDPDASRVLDIGCGAGFLAAAIRARCHGVEIWGIELLPNIAQEAEQSGVLDRVICADVSVALDDLPLTYFSHIVAGDVLEHLVDPWSVLAALREKMVSGGRFVCSIPNIRNLSLLGNLFLRGSFTYRDSGVMDRGHLRFFARKNVIDLFSGAGFTDIRVAPVRPKHSIIKRLGRALLGDLVIKGFLVTARAP